MAKLKLMWAASAVAAAALALTGCAQSSTSAKSGGDSGSKTVRVFISGDTNIQNLWEKDLGPAFEKANPGYKVQVAIDLHGEHDAQTLAKLSSSVEQKKDPGFDLVDGGFVPKASAANFLEPVDPSKVSALADIPADVIKAGGTGAIPYRGSSVLLAYDTKTVPTPPKTLDDLLAWIKANPGKFTYNSPKSGGSGGAFVATVLDKYVPADARQKMTVGYEKDLESYWDQGFAVLKGLNPYVYQKGVYPNGNQQTLALLANGQISMAPVWSDQFITGTANGSIPATIKATQISDPSFTGGAAYLGIPVNAPDKDAALKLANFVLQPEQQAMIVKDISGYPAISLDKLPKDLQEKFANANTNDLRKGYFDQMNKDLNNLWDQKVPGQ
ncbi:Polyamine ABC transporter substrate-binding protein [Sinomonas atrocyanea]|uniref:Polyamine ABC transporter substrate-binding protein n=1 Tax=Sinomonas atrocyanea TaxID=37927 RepID=A0A126ZWK6_9MICC|nr:extracellular solute-binding protein [Sinomonas atrocyanea]AMM31558.1 Polyamine ABC transporter substrate-binding protein [Sinomonas atrocyanea]GEB66630.1 ABC transporter substrate-binding protein [Sinomonas atrocyanea]GGG70207.1 ABC transporter substrate-binding protein [Sinomonas atrocyanea]